MPLLLQDLLANTLLAQRAPPSNLVRLLGLHDAADARNIGHPPQYRALGDGVGNGQPGGRTDGRTDGLTDGRTDGRTDGPNNVWLGLSRVLLRNKVEVDE